MPQQQNTNRRPQSSNGSRSSSGGGIASRSSSSSVSNRAARQQQIKRSQQKSQQQPKQAGASQQPQKLQQSQQSKPQQSQRQAQAQKAQASRAQRSTQTVEQQARQTRDEQQSQGERNLSVANNYAELVTFGDESVLTPDTLPFPCYACGACCKNVSLIEVLATHGYADEESSCKYLENDNVCTIYENRPLICSVRGVYDRYYSDSPWVDYVVMNMVNCVALRYANGIKEPEGSPFVGYEEEIALDILGFLLEDNEETQNEVDDDYDDYGYYDDEDDIIS